MKLKPRLSYERHLRGWSQARVAELIGTTAVNVGRWERGISKPRPYFQEKLCEIFGQDTYSLGLFHPRDDNMVF
jgi:transcriptional regulator with XRE-family HTH domain